jgi:hypothetical protein
MITLYHCSHDFSCLVCPCFMFQWYSSVIITRLATIMMTMLIIIMIIFLHHDKYITRITIMICMSILPYVNRIIPVPDMSKGWLFRSSACQFPAFQYGMAEQCRLFFTCLGSWANVALANNPLKYYRGYWHCIPVESPFAPPMFGVIWFHRTRRMGTCEFMLMYTCQTTLICGSPSPGARWALPVWGPHCITDFAASYRQLYKRKVLGLRIGMKVSYWT